MRHVIIGVGAAGITAAETIRNYREDDEIVMISMDDTVYSRCMLHKYLSHERNEKTINFVTEDFFDRNNIIWLKRKAVINIDTSNKIVYMADGEVYYDTLLIAAGANSNVPDVGAFLSSENVYGLRHLTDAKFIDPKIDTAEKVVVIGSGLVGLDMAYAMMVRGKAVTIVEMMDHILPKQLDMQASKAYQHLFEENGFEFRLGCRPIDTIIDDDEKVTHVLLDNGDQLECDIVIVTAGITPATDFLEGSGIAVDWGIKVDKYLRTSCPEVFAAGDINGLSGIWPNARKQGQIAAKNMCGIVTEYTDTFSSKNTINFFGLVTLSVGECNPEKDDTVYIRNDPQLYQKVIVRGNRIVGIILQGDISNSGSWLYLIKNQIDISRIKTPVWKISYADFYGLDEKGEYQWITP